MNVRRGIMGQENNMRQDTAARDSMDMQRLETARMAQQLSMVAFRSWEKALTGMFALPTAMMVGAAATALYATAFVERAFELFELSVSDIGMSVAREMDMMRRNGEPFASEGRTEVRANEMGVART